MIVEKILYKFLGMFLIPIIIFQPIFSTSQAQNRQPVQAQIRPQAGNPVAYQDDPATPTPDSSEPVEPIANPVDQDPLALTETPLPSPTPTPAVSETPPVDQITPTLPVSAEGLNAPGLIAPANAFASKDNTPDFSWNAITGADYYQIQISKKSDFSTKEEDVNPVPGSLAFTPLSILSEGTHYWRVKAYTSDNVAGAWSAYRSIIIDTIAPSIPVLKAPANNANVSSQKPTLTLNPAGGAKQYEYQVSLDSSFSSPLVNVIVPSTSYVLTDAQALTLSQTYYWRACAIDAALNTSDWSVPWQFTVTILSAPANGSYTTNTKPTFAWKSVTGAQEYYLQVDDDADFSSPLVDTFKPSWTSFAPPTPLGYNKYYWHVKVLTAAGWSEYMPAWLLTVSPTPPRAPTLVIPASGAYTKDTTPDFTWNSATNGVKYRIQIDTSSSFPHPDQDVTLDAGVLTYTATALAQGTFYWRVAALNYLDVQGKWSSSRPLIVDITPPNVPTLSSPADNFLVRGTPKYSWSASSDASGYIFEYGNDSTVYTSPLLTITSFTPPTQAVGDWYWHVLAQDKAGNQSVWSLARKISIYPYLITTPVLVSPANGATLTTYAVKFSWNSVAHAANYQIQVDTLATFTDPIYDGSGPVTSQLSAYLPNGTYYWHVRAMNANNDWSDWSAYRKMIVHAPADSTPPVNPTIASETGGAGNGAWQNGVSDPNFTWNGAKDGSGSGVAGYYVYWGPDPQGLGTSATWTAAAAYDPAAVTDPSVNYLRVQTKDYVGNLSSWTTLFTFKYDGTPPTNPGLVSSPSHTLSTWSADPTVDVSWSGAVDGPGSGVSGYSVEWTTSPTTIPDISVDTAGTSKTSPVLSTGNGWYVHIRTVDLAGNWSGEAVHYGPFFIDSTPPDNPAAASEDGGTNSGVWQHEVSVPAFTWSGENDSESGVAGYYIYWGTDPAGTSTNWASEAVYNPSAVASPSINYLRVATKDVSGNQSGWTTLFTFKYDATPPGSPTSASEESGTIDGVWQNLVSNPNFTWSGAGDGAGSGVSGYHIYWGTDPAGTSTTWTTDSAFDPAVVESPSTHYLRVQTQDLAGSQSNWTTLFTFRYDATLPPTATAITAGEGHNCAVTSAGGVKCWGSNANGELGDNTTTLHLTPVDVVGLSSGVKAVSAGYEHTCALTIVGGVKCWGDNEAGELGDNTTTERHTPVDVVGLSSGVKAISAKGDHTCALTSAGGVKCWGWNTSGQLGINQDVDLSSIPVDVVGLSSGVKAISNGDAHTCALTNAGGVKCWGQDGYGQLGNNNDDNRFSPVNVVGLSSGVKAISAGWGQTCALMNAGGVKCWGYNAYGELGDNTTTLRMVPVSVVGLSSGVTAISAGAFHTCALTSLGGVKCWGYNADGELGDNTTIDRHTPVDVAGLSTGITAVSTEDQPCALTSNGDVKCWGYNASGQVGDNTTTNRLTPVDVVGLSRKVTPDNPTVVIETGGADNGEWQHGVSDPSFTWSGANGGNGTGVAGYYVYWGIDSAGTSTTWTTAAAYNPAPVADGSVNYLRVQTRGNPGNLSDWTTLFIFKYDGTPPVNPSLISSSSHMLNVWSTDATVDINWSGATDAAGSGVSGYSIEWSTTPTTIPDTSVDTLAISATSPILTTGNSWYVHIRTVDLAGNWSTGAVHYGPFAIDSNAPGNPTSVTEAGGAVNGVWQNFISDANFTWSGASDGTGPGIAGYYVYWGTDPEGEGTSTSWTTAASYDPAAVTSPSINYLRVRTEDVDGNLSGWMTLFTFKYETSTPNNPITAREASGVDDGVWQNTVSDPNFTWRGASDDVSGVAGYHVYWGVDPTGTSTTWTTEAAYNPLEVSSPSLHYLRVQAQDFAGNQSNWTTLFTFGYDGTALLTAAISAGWSHTCALTTAGGLKCWGYNFDGEIGDNTTTDRLAPVDVVGLSSGVKAISAGDSHTCALTGAGGVKCWGWNIDGQLGDKTKINRNIPVDVSGLSSGMKAISAGDKHTCALTNSGSVKCWGYNYDGEVGDNTTTNRLTPVDVNGLTSGMKAISAGGRHTCALTGAGGVKCWGYNGEGELGDNTVARRLTPVDVVGLSSGVKAIAGGGEHSCALTDAGGVKCWGNNKDGQLGDNTITNRHGPVDVIGLSSGVIAISAGYDYTCALTDSGGVKCWGYNSTGELGDNTTTDRHTPVDVIGLNSEVTAISAGESHTCALTSTMGVKCWGNNTSGGLGDNTVTNRLTPVEVIGLSGVRMPGNPTVISETGGAANAVWQNVVSDPHFIWSGASGGDGIGVAGYYVYWGPDGAGTSTNWTTEAGYNPSAVADPSTNYLRVQTKDVAGGLSSWATLFTFKYDGTAPSNPTDVIEAGGAANGGWQSEVNDPRFIWSGPIADTGSGMARYYVYWGTDSTGTSTTWTTTPGYDPAAVESPSTYYLRLQMQDLASNRSSWTTLFTFNYDTKVMPITAAISAGIWHTCALTRVGGVKCWGDNGGGELGDNTTTGRQIPVDVVGLSTGVTVIAAGNGHTCALTSTGGVKCWGSNGWGQLGDNTFIDRWAPVDVTGLSTGVKAITAGGTHTCALTNAGSVKCWGNDSWTAGWGAVPEDVVGLGNGVTAISAGMFHTCALTSSGGVKCWGANHYGQLGVDPAVIIGGPVTPVDVIGLSSGVTAISAGGYHTCALTNVGALKCWGDNEYGQLGNNTQSNSWIPLDVIGLSSGVTVFSAGEYHTCALTNAEGMKCWGDNDYGELGNNTQTNSWTPVDVIGLSNGVMAISAGEDHTCVLTSVGGVKCWGARSGNSMNTLHLIPVDVAGLTKPNNPTIVHEAGGAANGFWQREVNDPDFTWSGASDGSGPGVAGYYVYWGPDSAGTSTIWSMGPGYRPGKVENSSVHYLRVQMQDLAGNRTSWITLYIFKYDATPPTLVDISTGSSSTCALTSAEGVICWGGNYSSKLDQDTASQRLIPLGIVGMSSGVTSISSGWGDEHCAVISGGGVKCWWDGSMTPVDVVGLSDGVTAISVGYAHTCALTSTGGVKCWGFNGYGELGDNTNIDSSTPVDVVGLNSGVTAIAVGQYHTCALIGTGGMKCWGYNYFGQLGNNTTISSSIPVDVVGLGSAITAISAGGYHTCALTGSGGVKCWGIHGILGDNTTIDRHTPVDVVGLSNGVKAISAGVYHTCALTSAGGVKCWGDNNYGDLGNNMIDSYGLPVDVVGLSSGVTAIAAGGYESHTCALTSTGGAKCWGDNAEGQLGDFSTTDRWTPVDVIW
jgi:alpha-tubulin suppressor-like RCC1 family protein